MFNSAGQDKSITYMYITCLKERAARPKNKLKYTMRSVVSSCFMQLST